MPKILLLLLLLVLVGLVTALPLKKDKEAKREIESVHFGNHQNKVPLNEGMADAQLLGSYLGPQKRAQILKENANQDEDSDDKEKQSDKKKKKKRVVIDDVDDWGSQYPTYYNYYNNYRPSPIISPEDNLPYVPAFRRRRASPIASAKSHQKKNSLPSTVSKFLRRRRSAGYDLVDPETLVEIFNSVAAEEALEQLEEDMEDNDYYDRYEFKYPYYPGMVDYMAHRSDEQGPPEEEYSHWLDMSPAQMMQVRAAPKKRYSFPYIPMPGQKRDQIDTPSWGKIQDTATQRKRQQGLEELYELANRLSDAGDPEDNSLSIYRRSVL